MLLPEGNHIVRDYVGAVAGGDLEAIKRFARGEVATATKSDQKYLKVLSDAARRLLDAIESGRAERLLREGLMNLLAGIEVDEVDALAKLADAGIPVSIYAGGPRVAVTGADLRRAASGAHIKSDLSELLSKLARLLASAGRLRAIETFEGVPKAVVETPSWRLTVPLSDEKKTRVLGTVLEGPGTEIDGALVEALKSWAISVATEVATMIAASAARLLGTKNRGEIECSTQTERSPARGYSVRTAARVRVGGATIESEVNVHESVLGIYICVSTKILYGGTEFTVSDFRSLYLTHRAISDTHSVEPLIRSVVGKTVELLKGVVLLKTLELFTRSRVKVKTYLVSPEAYIEDSVDRNIVARYRGGEIEVVYTIDAGRGRYIDYELLRNIVARRLGEIPVEVFVSGSFARVAVSVSSPEEAVEVVKALRGLASEYTEIVEKRRRAKESEPETLKKARRLIAGLLRLADIDPETVAKVTGLETPSAVGRALAWVRRSLGNSIDEAVVAAFRSGVLRFGPHGIEVYGHPLDEVCPACYRVLIDAITLSEARSPETYREIVASAARAGRETVRSLAAVASTVGSIIKPMFVVDVLRKAIEMGTVLPEDVHVILFVSGLCRYATKSLVETMLRKGMRSWALAAAIASRNISLSDLRQLFSDVFDLGAELVERVGYAFTSGDLALVPIAVEPATGDVMWLVISGESAFPVIAPRASEAAARAREMKEVGKRYSDLVRRLFACGALSREEIIFVYGVPVPTFIGERAGVAYGGTVIRMHSADEAIEALDRKLAEAEASGALA